MTRGSVDAPRPHASGRDQLIRNEALDGLRAFAVANVVFGHMALPLGGAQGVTIFFVISGYLITGLLLKEREERGTIALPRFYRRRFVRLGPALLLATAAYVGWLLATHADPHQWWTSLVGTLTYTNDLILAIGNGTPGPDAAMTWSWSLGIEEQFYLLWPLLILLVLRFRPGRKLLAALCGVLIVAAWLIRWQLSLGAPSLGRSSYSFDTNMDAIAWGALLAILLGARVFSRRQRVIAQLALPALLVVAVLLKLAGYGPRFSFDLGTKGVVAIVAAALVLGLAAAPRGPLGRVLGWQPLVYLGWLSYGIYLWNTLVIRVIDKAVGISHPFVTRASLATSAATLLAIVAAAALSYHLVEQPIRRRWANPRPAAITATEESPLPETVGRQLRDA